jgi:bifunctional non-homologous end joining protein LigD
MAGPRGGWPPLLMPMLATAARELPGDESRWAAEVKWDGMRALAYVSGGRIMLRSRAGRDVTSAYPELAAVAAAAGSRTLVIDGEIVALAGGRPSFSALQRRMHVTRPGPRLAAAVPVTFMAFDLLVLEHRSLLRSPYEDRRELLEGLFHGHAPVAVPPAFPGDAEAVLLAVQQLGLEGVVCKRLGSAYLPGRRGRSWLKIRRILAADLAIGGWLPRSGRPRLAGSLLVGSPGQAGLLDYRGQVGAGLSGAVARDLGEALEALALPAPPFAGQLPREITRHARWARPVLTCEVGYAGLTGAGRLRHAVWRGLRPGPPGNPEDL